LEKAMTESFEQGKQAFEYPAFKAPQQLDTTRQRYMLLCLLSTVAAGTLVAGRMGYKFVQAKAELAQSIAETVQDAASVVQEYRNGTPQKAASPRETPTEPPDKADKPG
jgi:hypothetical protein